MAAPGGVGPRPRLLLALAAGLVAAIVVVYAPVAHFDFVALDDDVYVRQKSAFVAAVFALHPVHVESVMWIAERKDVYREQGRTAEAATEYLDAIRLKPELAARLPNLGAPR